MKALLEKIRKILRSRRTRQIFTRFVSGVAAVVVFVTTYALVLPAITLEQNASCGIPEHQHTDACYEERLVCETPEGEGHHHDASCYDKILICGQEVHVHSPECYQEDSSAVVSSGSAAAASTAFGAAAEQDVLYGTDSSVNDQDALATDSYAAGEDAGEEGVEETTQTAETAAEKSAAEESASDQAVGESGTDNTAAEGSDSGESDAEEADEKRDTVAGEYDAGEAAPEESAQDGSDSGIADTEGLKDSEDRNSEENKTADATDSNEAVNGSASDTSNAENEDAENEDAAAAGTEETANEATTNVLPEPVETENLSKGYVPKLDSIELDSVLNRHTDFYYFHPEQGQEIPETSAEVTDWKKVKNGLFGSTKLESTDLVKMYLSYTIPAGTLNETNQVVRYRLPSNVHLTDEQIIAINETENGMSSLYADAADAASNTGEQAQDENQTEDENAAGYQKYLGAEAIEGTRRPDQKLKEGAQEYISAIVKAENVFDDEGIYGEKGAFLGQDLIFIFTPYSIEKNQITYNADGDPLSAGEKITGWFACDFNMSQIGWVEQDTDLDNSTVEKTAEIVFVEKDSEKNVKEISRTLKLVDEPEDESDAASGETVDEAQTAASAETAAAAETASVADTSAVAETAGTADTALEKASEDKAAGAEDKEDAEDGPFKAGTITADGDGYRITLDYTEKAEIPENAELSVREITAETDKEAYEACLEQAGQQVAADEKTGVDRKASRFFDIEILVRDKDSDGKEETRKIEPSAPVSVNIQIIDDQAAEDSGSEDSGSEDKKSGQSEPAVLHFAEEGVEQIDAAVKDSQEQETEGGEDKSAGKESEPSGSATEISFEAESFSIYGVVYTVDFHWEVDGKTYDFSIPGGGFVSFEHLVELLGISRDTDNTQNVSENEENAENGENGTEESSLDAGEESDTSEGTVYSAADLNLLEISEETRNFVSNVEKVEFSSPELVWVGKTDADITVESLKEANELECQYSADLTEEQITEINAQTVKAGDWALISLLPFDTEESLLVTMKNGDRFTVKVTDAHPVADAEATTIDVNKSYLIVYQAGNKYYLLKNDGTVDDTKTPANSHNFEDLNSTYAWTFSHVFKEQDIDTNLDNNYYLIRPIDNKSKTLALNFETSSDHPLVQTGNNNTGVIPVSGGGFTLQGYHNIADEGEEHRYIQLGFENGAFCGIDGTGVTIHIYEMDSLPAYDYTVRSSDETRGTVTVQGGTQQTASDGTHYYDATSDSDKKNEGTITAVPVDHKNWNATDPNKRNENKWLFDHWEQDGVPLDRQQYGRIINAGDLSIPFNGSNLIAYFKQNPEYEVPDNEKEPSSFEDMSNWLTDLENKSVPLDQQSTKKTAEVYDYENRIYRVDITSKANFKTFDGNVDMAFCMDVSNSMFFPSALVETTSTNHENPMPIYQINDSGWRWSNQGWLDTNRGYNNPYYLIADQANTATVFRIYYKDGNWKAQDASRNPENDKSFVIGQSFQTNWAGNTQYPFNEGDDSNTNYTIYDAGDEGRNRFYYLNQAFSGANDDLLSIKNILEVAGAESPKVNVAYNTFNRNLGDQRQDFQPVKQMSGISLQNSANGGTRPDQAFNDAKSFNWQGKSRYVILITDGAPQGIRDGEANTTTTADIRAKVREAAQGLKDEDDVKFITIGLSMNDVVEGRKLLYDLADADKNGDKMFYLAESASDLHDILRQIINTVMEDAVVYSDVTDTVNDAFYLVDKNTGLPLKSGDKIDIEGILTVDDSKVAGVVQPDGRTIKWLNQPIDQRNGWHGTVYVKAKEDLIGGNAVKTNGEAKIEATKYRIGGQDYPFDDSLINSKLKSLRIPFESPRVNVNELSFPSTETEWTVYLGENVDPKLQLKKLYEGIDIIEVVNKDGSLHYPLSPNSISDERGSESSGEPATFKLADTVLDIIRADSALSSKYISNGGLNWDAFLTDILKDGGVTIPYHPYGIEGEDSNIVISLTKTIKGQEEQDLVGESPHDTTVTGDEVEKYVLTAKYNPDYDHVLPVGQGGKNEDPFNFHTGTFGTMYQGHAAGRETSRDTHVINVYKKTLDVLKTDTSTPPIPLTGAEFKLYVKNDENGQPVDGLTGKYREVASAESGANGIAHLESQTEDLLTVGTTYYLVETEAPEKYQKDNTVYAVEIQVEEGKYSSGEWVYKEDDKETRYSTGTPTQDPYNWNQGARILVNGKPVTAITRGSSEGQTVEVVDGSYISNNNAISFRHPIKNKGNEITLTVNKTWENVDNKPDSVRFELYRVSEKGHKWGEPTIVHSTCSEAGVEEYTCLVCGKKDTHTIEATGHTPGTAQRENETAPTCTVAGGYDTVVRCKVCNAVISSKHTEIPAIGHDWGEWVVTTPPQPGVAGVKTRVCNHDRTHTETREIDPLPNNTAITYRTYRNWWGLGWLESTTTSSQKFDIGSTVTVSWSSSDRYNSVVYIGCNPVVSQYAYIADDNVNGYEFPDGTVKDVTREYNGRTGKYDYSVTVTVTKDMTLDIVSSSWPYYPPSDLNIVQNRRNSVRTLNASNQVLKSARLLGAGDTSPGEMMSSDQLSALLNGIKSKDEVSCEEHLNDDQIDQADHTYKELAGTYTITADNEGRWTWTSNDLPKYNEYGNEYTYYVKEIDPSTGYETTYLGQTDGLHDGDTAVINNKILKGSLLITKNVRYNNRTASTDAEKALVNGSYTFVVKKGGVEIAGSPFTITVTNGISNSILIPDLEKGEDYTIEETGSGNLTLKTVSGGAAVNNNIVTAVVTAGKLTEADLLDTAKAEFTNNYTAYEVTIVKVDTADTSKLLGNAIFDLYDENSVEGGETKHIKEGARPIRSNLTTASSGSDKGKVSLGSLTPGTYYLFETKAPAGYNTLEAPVKIIIYEDTISLIQGSRTEAGVISQEKTELTVMNTAGVELPSTGGTGTCLFTLPGALLVAFAGAVLIMRRLRRAK